MVPPDDVLTWYMMSSIQDTGRDSLNVQAVVT